MSRTYKDRPHWVQVRDRRNPTRVRHRHHGTYWQKLRGTVVPGCDLAEFDAAKGKLAARNPFNCDRVLTGPMHRRYAFKWGHAPRWFAHHVWFEPDRVRQRDELRCAAKEYRAHVGAEEFDFDFANYQHGHCARWLWD